ncbi:DNA internalization-related competence protein ComEC/Rec2 [Blautia sp. 2744]|uniref:DNA internalization-related competence protein ComEC/Rec2 n=1 Tax=Blautia intestinalis TaxID=2763028 RepID=A0ABR7I253_9FIRM|nr:DNA internalization-related competence protein ComEC/Rec2 [Blautia intestinalis]MBC5740566.1 DNA internalization-related competence protein ComEC/Rec2 [Blautia intestinalis]RHD34069.1 DNA internalization-related competence protein ComEC/Rec2 [Blautia obeum]
MKRRPVCLVCLFLMLCLYVTDLVGISMINGNPLPVSVQKYISEHPKLTVSGEVQECQAEEYSLSVYLKQVCLTVGSEQIPIENIKVYLNKEEQIRIGMFLRVCGKLEEIPGSRNPGEFDSKQYYACRKIYYQMKDGEVCDKSTGYSYFGQFLQEIRQKAETILDEAAGAYAGIFQAMILGERGNLDAETKMQYQMAGIMHILAISGLHISFVGMGFFRLLKKAGAGNGVAGAVSAFLIYAYGIVTGGSVSAMRAVGMFLVLVGAGIAGRSYDLLSAMALSAIVLLLDAPAYLYNVSFLLSFGAVIGIGALTPEICSLLNLKKRTAKSLAGSVIVWLITLPIALHAYGEVSLAGVILNLLVLPTSGIVLASGIFALPVGIFVIEIAKRVVFPGKCVLFLYEKLCEVVGWIPHSTWIAGSPQLWQCAVYYVMLGVAFTGVKWGKKAASVALVIFAVVFLGYHSRNGLAITCLDIGQGDCCVLKMPGGENFLIDGGSSNKKNTAVYQILPYLKNQGIAILDGIFVSHTDQDHISGIEELLELCAQKLTTVRVKNLILPDWDTTGGEYEKLKMLAEQTGIRVQTVREGNLLKTKEAQIEILAPENGADGSDTNEDGMVMKVHFGKFRGLFTGDIGAETEKKLLDSMEDVDFLKVAHHGSKYSTCQGFLDVVSPEIAVISCSAKNTYGHPSADTIKKLEDCGAQVEYTMKNGAITVRTDGEGIWLDRFID